MWLPQIAPLEAEHEVFAPTLPGHWGGPPAPRGDELTMKTLVDATERQLDAAGIERAHLVGNSLGGWLAFELASRGRALSVTAISPGCGWREGGFTRAGSSSCSGGTTARRGRRRRTPTC